MTSAVPAARRPAVLSDLIPGALLRDIALVVGGAALVGLLAQLSFPIPGSPVPVTGQTLGVLLGGAALGWRRGATAMTLYLVAGVAGVPWFAGHGHGAALASLGYVIAYPFAAAAVGALAGHGGDRTPVRMLVSMAIGSAIIYGIGVPYLALDAHLSAGIALHEGVTPFLIGDALKAVAAAGLLPATWAMLRHYGDK